MKNIAAKATSFTSSPGPMAGKTYAIPAFAGSATARENGRKGRHMANEMEGKTAIPTIQLDALDLHAPEAIRLIARKVRGVDPARADELERTAKKFETWRQAYLRR